jgi:hypothetical protein
VIDDIALACQTGAKPVRVTFEAKMLRLFTLNELPLRQIALVLSPKERAVIPIHRGDRRSNPSL